MKEYEDTLQDLCLVIREEKLRLTVMDCIAKRELLTTGCPASLGHHHAYERGLLVHTVEVAKYCVQIAKTVDLEKPVDMSILIAAALIHDLEKTKEYVLRTYYEGQQIPNRHLTSKKGDGYKEVWVYSDYGNRIHHIQGSYGLFMASAAHYGVSDEVQEAVGHAVLAHHGPNKDWGSPVKPQTAEALILHQADSLSAFHGKTFYKP